jgi:hypothetical protein
MAQSSYAVYWNEPDGPRYAGRLTLGPAFAELVGAAGAGGRSLSKIFFDEIASVRYERRRLASGATSARRC